MTIRQQLRVALACVGYLFPNGSTCSRAAKFCMLTRADVILDIGWVFCRWGSSFGRKWNF